MRTLSRRIYPWLLATFFIILLVALTACSGAGAQPTTPVLTSPEAIVAQPTSYPVQVPSLETASPEPPASYPAPADPSQQPAETAAVPSPYPPPANQPLAAYPAPTLAAAAEPTQAVEAPTEPSLTATPTRVVKQELEASDPAAVQLASGKVQLVEFFAFW